MVLNLLGGYMKLYLISICLLLSACASLPPAFEEAPVTNVTYDQVREDLEGYNKTLVRWGGVIVDVDNVENASLMQVIHYPLDYYGRPQLSKPSEGRFVIKSAELLDPEAYAAERELIVLGVIAGEIERTMRNETRVWLPLINATAIHLWPINYRGDYYGNCPSCYFRQLFW